MRILLSLSLWLWASAPASGLARDAVLLLETADLRPELCSALRIQLTDLADVRCRLDPTPDELALRIASASREVASGSVRLAVLLERDPSVSRVRMLLVGAQPDQAVLAIESVEDRPAPDVDRSLALKVRDTLELLEGQPAPVLARVLTVPAREANRLRFEAGGALSAGTHTRGAGLLGLGVQLRRAGTYAELMLEARLLQAVRASSDLGTVDERAWGLTLGARAGRRVGPLMLGALAEVGLLWSHAVGVTSDGSRGAQTLAIARLGAGIDVRVVLLEGPASVSLRLAPTLQIDPRAQRYELDRQRVLSLGRLHAWLPLSLCVELPLQGMSTRARARASERARAGDV